MNDKLLTKFILSFLVEKGDYLKLSQHQQQLVFETCKTIMTAIYNAIKYENVYANEFIYQNNNIVSINKTNELSNNLGKVLIAKNIPGNNIIIGDGYTDYEVKKEKAAIKFIQYAENINRKKLNKHADIIAFNFNEIIDFINNLTL